ncbi:MAG: helix-turn-helix transcriptional regulator [Clostridia bacterium]|nr:helix-turn-helix transcriptional regulator [Clostridia bacterium]
MRIEDISARIRFADRFEYTCSRPLSKTYDSRLLYITGGEGNISVGGRYVRAEKGMLIAFQGGTPYKIEPCPSFSAFAVDFDLCEGYKCEGFLFPVLTELFDEEKLHKRVYFENSDFLAVPFAEHVHSGIEEDIRRLVEEYNSGRTFSGRRAELILNGVFLELADSLTLRTKGAKCAKRVCDYISEHYREPLSNESVARAFGHEPCYLNRTVKLNTGMPIHKLLTKKRVDEGVKLLLTTDLSLEQIAERVGFCTASHFSKRCKDVTGNMPSFYRKH